MRIAIASGKGGTGKTTVAVNLALTAVRAGLDVHLGDCDVEEPNAHLFLEPELTPAEPVRVPVPVLDPEICSHCGDRMASDVPGTNHRIDVLHLGVGRSNSCIAGERSISDSEL